MPPAGHAARSLSLTCRPAAERIGPNAVSGFRLEGMHFSHTGMDGRGYFPPCHFVAFRLAFPPACSYNRIVDLHVTVFWRLIAV